MFMHDHAPITRATFVSRLGRIIAMVLGGMAIAVLIGSIFGLLVQYLWNWLMPSLFALPSITYWQAFGLIVLSRLLVGGMGHGHHHKGFHSHHFPPGMRKDIRGKIWKLEGGEKDWKYFPDYWWEQGKTDFEQYIRTKKNEDKPQ